MVNPENVAAAVDAYGLIISRLQTSNQINAASAVHLQRWNAISESV